MIVRWGLDSLPQACADAGVSSPVFVAGPRWDSFKLSVPVAGRWREVPSDRVSAAAEVARDADGVLAVGGGST